MKILYAPWRSDYLNNNTPSSSSDECIFCSKFNEKKDETHFIIKRFDHTVVMLNLYPYNAGHLLILPLAHKGNLEDLDPEVRFELMEVITLSNAIIKRVLNCDALNVGLNLGKASGGSQPDHLHFHCVPRWWSDTNFLVTTADTKVIPTDLGLLYRNLKKEFR